LKIKNTVVLIEHSFSKR